jgi:hypothetical protein
MPGHVTMLTGLVSRSRRMCRAGDAKNNNACQCRNSGRIFEKRNMFHDVPPVSSATLL